LKREGLVHPLLFLREGVGDELGEKNFKYLISDPANCGIRFGDKESNPNPDKPELSCLNNPPPPKGVPIWRNNPSVGGEFMFFPVAISAIKNKKITIKVLISISSGTGHDFRQQPS